MKMGLVVVVEFLEMGDKLKTSSKIAAPKTTKGD